MGKVLVLGEDALVGPLVREHLAGLHVRAVSGLELAAERILVGCVAVCASGVGPQVLSTLHRIRASYPLSRVILVTELTPDTVACLAKVPSVLNQLDRSIRVPADVSGRSPPRVLSRCLAAFLLLVLAAPVAVAGQSRDLVHLTANGLVGGVAAGLAQSLRGGGFADGFKRGVVGGAVHYAGKRLMGVNLRGALFVGRQVSAVGGSIVGCR